MRKMFPSTLTSPGQMPCTVSRLNSKANPSIGARSFTATISTSFPLCIAAFAVSIPILPKPFIPTRTATASSIRRRLLLTLLFPDCPAFDTSHVGLQPIILPAADFPYSTGHRCPSYFKAPAVLPTSWSRRSVTSHEVQQSVRVLLRQDEGAVLWVDETLGYRLVEERRERLPEAIHVQKTARLLVHAQLRPGKHLGELFERPVAPGQGNEAVGEVGHQLFALVHRADDVEFAEAGVGDLLGNERLGDHTDDLATLLKRRVRHGPHQPDPTAAVDQPEFPVCDLLAHIPRGLYIGRTRAFPGTAEHAHRLHRYPALSASLRRRWLAALLVMPPSLASSASEASACSSRSASIWASAAGRPLGSRFCSASCWRAAATAVRAALAASKLVTRLAFAFASPRTARASYSRTASCRPIWARSVVTPSTPLAYATHRPRRLTSLRSARERAAMRLTNSSSA